MQGTTQNYTLDMVDERKKEPLRVKQYDTNSRWARISLTAFGEPWSIPVGSRGYISIKKVDGNTVLNDCTIEGENVVLAPISEQTTAVQGIQQAELYFLAVDGDIKSQTFPINVYPAIMDQRIIESSNEFGTLQTAIIGAQEATRTAQDAASEAMVQAGEAREAAEIAIDAAASLDVAVQAAAAAKTSETNAKASEAAAAQAKADVEALKEGFIGYDKIESGRRYANALTTMKEGNGQVVVTDAWEAPVVSLEVDGASEQVVTTGAQLLVPQITNNRTGCAASLTEDGKIKLKGQAAGSNNRDIYLFGSWNSTESYGIRGQHTLSCEQNEKLFDMYVLNNSDTMAGTTEKSVTFTPTEEKPVTGIFLRLKTGINYDCTLSIMLNEGSTAQPWEPYTGGKPSPSPDYPQEIVSVAHVANSGAQLFDASRIPTKTASGVTVTNNGDGSFTISGNGELTEDFYISVNLTREETVRLFRSGGYTLSGNKTYPYVFFKLGDLPEWNLTNNQSVRTVTRDAIENENVTAQFGFYGMSGKSIVSGTTKPMFNAGITAQPWEPYNGQQREIDLEVESAGANLFDINNVTFSTNAIPDNSFIKINNGVKFTVSSNANFGGLYGFDIPKESGYYNMSCDIIVSSKDFNSIKVGFEGHLTKQVVPGDFTGNIAYFQIAGEISNQKSLILYVDNIGKTPGVSVEFANIMIAKGATPLPWEPYTGYQKVTIPLAEPLRGTGDARDRICMKNGIWGIERKVTSILYDGIDKKANKTNKPWDEKFPGYTHAELTHGINWKIGQNLFLSDLFICTTDEKRDFKSISLTCHTSTDYLYLFITNEMVGITEATDDTEKINAVNAWIREHNFAVTYELATPTWEPFPESTQAALNALTTHPGTTYLTVTSTDVSATVRMEYVQDTRKVIDALQLDVAEQMVELQAQIDQLKVTNNLS